MIDRWLDDLAVRFLEHLLERAERRRQRRAQLGEQPQVCSGNVIDFGAAIGAAPWARPFGDDVIGDWPFRHPEMLPGDASRGDSHRR